MKAMILARQAAIESSPLSLVDVEPPVPTGTQVRVAVRCCALCRTDLHVIEGDLPAHKLPLIPGHQVVGVVDRLGPNCRRLALGQRVGIAWLRHTCGQCRYCLSGRENLCEQQLFTGYDADGGYAQYAVIDEDYAYDIPPAFGDLEAAPLLCAGIVGYRALKRANVPDKGRLAIYGFGSSAHIIAQIAIHRGVDLYVVSRDDKHVALARKLGAVWAGQRAQDLPVKVDSAILFAPVGTLVPIALEHLDKGGTLAIAGIYLTPIPALDYNRHVFYERDIRSVTANTRDDGRELLQEAARAHVHPQVQVYALDKANQGLQDLKADRISGTGVLSIA